MPKRRILYRKFGGNVTQSIPLTVVYSPRNFSSAPIFYTRRNSGRMLVETYLSQLTHKVTVLWATIGTKSMLFGAFNHPTNYPWKKAT